MGGTYLLVVLGATSRGVLEQVVDDAHRDAPVLRVAGLVEPKDADALKDGYNFLRGVESGLRLMNTLARHDLPISENELSRLAYVLNLKDGDELVQQCEQFRQSHSRLFAKYLA